jgi:hypothetical protein
MSIRISRMTQYTISVTEISTKISYHFHVDSSRMALNTHWLHHTVSDLAWSQISLYHLASSYGHRHAKQCARQHKQIWNQAL